MIPSAFEQENGILVAPEGVSSEEMPPLSVFQDGKVTISCWKMTKEELEEVIRTGRIWLMVYGDSMPPVLVTGMEPFE